MKNSYPSARSGLTILLISLLTSGYLYGQYDKINFYPPETSSLMRYVDYPVSHKTGIPDIRIPLHTISIGRIVIPFELSFHIDNYARVNQIPGCVGAGWSLTPDIQVSRSINGLDDFSPNGYYTNTTIESDYSGDYVSRSKLHMNQIHQGIRDDEPDRFYYRLLGKSGAFYFQRQGNGSMKAVAVPYDGVKIEYINQQFTITDDDGTKYIFSTSKRDGEASGLLSNSITAWKCEKVISPSGVEEVSFTYGIRYTNRDINSYSGRIEVYDDINDLQPGNSYYCMTCRSDQGDVNNYAFWLIAGPKMKKYGGRKSEFRPLGSNGQFDEGFPEYYVGGAPARSYTDLSYYMLTEISFRGGRATYTYTDHHILSGINIYNSSGEIVKTITFTQENTGYARQLKSVKPGNEEYSFTYEFQHKGNVVSDFWGYDGFDPGSYIQTSVPIQNIKILMGNNPRFFMDCATINWPDVQVNVGDHSQSNIFDILSDRNILTIKYPTGGLTKYIIGQNRFRGFYDGVIKRAGGYRIEKIQFFNDASPTPVWEKIYKYGKDEDGAGIIKNEPSFDPYFGTSFTEQKVSYYGIGAMGSFLLNTARKRTFLSGTIKSLNFEGGAPVLYNEVAEYNSDMGQYTGKTVYKYNLPGYVSEYASPTDPYPFHQEEWDIAPLDSIIHYQYRNGTFQWIKRKKYTYHIYTDPIQIFRGRVWVTEIPEIAFTLPSADPIAPSEFMIRHGGIQYKYSGIKTGCMQLVKEEEYQRDHDANIIKEEARYFYDNPSRIIANRIEKVTSDGTEIIEQSVYTNDYMSGGFVSALANNHIIIPIEKITRKNGIILSGEINTFNSAGALVTNHQLEESNLPESGFRLSNKTVAGNFLTDNPGSAYHPDIHYRPKYRVDRYDQYMNPQQITPEDHQVPICYLWSYNGLYPIAKIMNATYNEISGILTETLINRVSSAVLPSNADMTAINNLRNVKSILISTYTYKPHVGMTSETDPSGRRFFYEYDHFGKLKYVRDEEGNILKEHRYHYQQP